MPNRKNQLYEIKLLPHLTSQLDLIFPLELWDIIADYCFYAECLLCPLTKKLFENPVMIDHPKIASLVYEKEAIERIIALGELRKYGITSQTIHYLKPVPIIKCMIDYVVYSKQYDLNTEFNNHAISTNLTEELKSQFDVDPTFLYSRKKIINFINLFNYPVAARSNTQELNLFSPSFQKGIVRACVLGGLLASTNTLIKLYQSNLDRRFTLPALFLGINVAENILAITKFVLREAQALNLHHYFRALILPPPILNQHVFFKEFKQRLIKLCEVLFLRADILNSLGALNPSHYLEAIGFAHSLYNVGIPFCALDMRMNTIGSRQVIKEYKKISANPYHLFSTSRDSNGFIEPLANKTISRLGKLSHVLLAGILTFAATKNPLLALLAFVSALLFQGNVNALSNESQRLSLIK